MEQRPPSLVSVSPLRYVTVSYSPLTTTITINRPKVLNAFNLNTLAELHSLITIGDTKRLILRGSGKAFCAGGDVVHLSRQLQDCIDFFRETYALCYRIDSRKGWSVAFMKGVTMGGGAGISYACKARVATPSTLWAFPETTLGSVPDAGANFILTRLSSKPVGLYLALTGDRLNGSDCFYLGIATHYISEDSQIPEIESVLASEPDPYDVLARYHRTPNLNSCKVLQKLEDIEECFSNVTSVEEILDNLRGKNTSWSRATLEAMLFVCPLSLKVEFRAFEMAGLMTYGECLDLEYDMVVQMTVVRSANYKEGVQHRLVRKEKTRPRWSPGELHEVDPTEVQACLTNVGGPHLRTALIKE